MKKTPSGTRVDRALLSRRETVRLLAGASLLPFVPLLGCGGGVSASATPDSGASGVKGSESGSAGEWAKGGTVAMVGKASCPDPFTGALSACALVASTTEGPCTTSSDLDREDISEGLSGLPLRLALKVVDASCEPLEGAVVKIWHTNAEGSYSGQTPNNGMCLKQSSYSAQDFFRGVQTTDSAGGSISIRASPAGTAAVPSISISRSRTVEPRTVSRSSSFPRTSPRASSPTTRSTLRTVNRTRSSRTTTSWLASRALPAIGTS